MISDAYTILVKAASYSLYYTNRVFLNTNSGLHTRNDNERKRLCARLFVSEEKMKLITDSNYRSNNSKAVYLCDCKYIRFSPSAKKLQHGEVQKRCEQQTVKNRRIYLPTLLGVPIFFILAGYYYPLE